MKILLTAFAAAFVALVATSPKAAAGVVVSGTSVDFYQHGTFSTFNKVAGVEQIKFNDPALLTSGPVVQGITQTGFVLDASSTDGTDLSINANGHGGFAKIEGLNGVDFEGVLFFPGVVGSPAANLANGIMAFGFDADIIKQPKKDVATLTYTVSFLDGSSETFSQTTSGNGLVFGGFTAKSGSLIRSVSLVVTDGLARSIDDLRHIRVNGMVDVGDETEGGALAAPEPGSLALVIIGLVGFGGYARRRMRT